MDAQLLKPAEAAELLGVGRATVYRLIKKHLLPVVRFRRTIRVPRAAILQLIEDDTAEFFSGRKQNMAMNAGHAVHRQPEKEVA